MNNEQHDRVSELLNSQMWTLSQPWYKSTLTFEEFKSELKEWGTIDILYKILYESFREERGLDQSFINQEDDHEEQYIEISGYPSISVSVSVPESMFDDKEKVRDYISDKLLENLPRENELWVGVDYIDEIDRMIEDSGYFVEDDE